MDGIGYAFSANITATMERYDNEVAGSILAKATKMCRDFGDVKVGIRVEEGDLICQVDEKLSPHVLVMGRHGYGLIIKCLWHHCAQRVKCLVLIVKKPKSA